jgi:EAL domain-containing protein (putative c-di-GMP-specific phosphodiesterase class I)
MQTAIETRAALESDLHTALELGQFRLFYQVQVNANHRPQGAEVLLRWIHPDRGMVSPAQFIPLAEETGLILPIGAWVLDTACAQIKQWESQLPFRNLTLAVNVSAKQFRQPDFVAQVQSAIARHAINPTSLKLELTESLVLDNVDDTIAKMRELKDIGVSFAMDDFGTGYSSLSYLKRLPLTQLKIDQSFVRDLATDHGDMVMVMTIVDLGMNFELDVIAEGVETEAQFKLLHRYGCTSFQGYLFSRPIPVEEFEVLIAHLLLK